MTVRGVDFANPRPDPGRLKAEGIDFVVRYLSPNTPANPRKHLTAGELAAYRAAELAVVVVWETTTDRATQGRAAAQRDASVADAYIRALGFPAGQPIYFAVDEDTTGAAVAAYFQGVASVIGIGRTGCYGGYKPISYLFDHRLVTYGWQTYAWSSGRWDSRAQARQTHNGQTVAGVVLDLDEAAADDYGQWAPEGAGNEADVALSASDIDAVAAATAQKILGADINPGAGSYSLSGALWVAFQRTAILAAGFPTAAQIAAAVAGVLPASGSTLTADEVASAVVDKFATTLGSAQ